MVVGKVKRKLKYNFIIINSRNEAYLKRKQNIFDIILPRICLDIIKAEDDIMRNSLELHIK